MSDSGEETRRKRFTAHVPTPTKLKISEEGLATRWKQFARSWKNYEKASRLEEESDDYRCSVLLACIGDEAMEVFDGFQFKTGESREQIDTVMKKFEEFCVGKTHEAFESYRFHIRAQGPEESIEAYVAELRKLARNCNFKEEDRMIRDRIVVGVRSNSVREKLLEIEDLDLQKAINTCKLHETSQQQLQAMNAGASGSSSVEAIKSRQPDKKKGFKKNDNHRNSNSSKQNCGRCGRPKHEQKDQCRAINAKCESCGRIGHFWRQCRTKDAAKVGKADLVKTDSEKVSEAFLGSVSQSKRAEDPWRVDIEMRGRSVNFKLDTGADVTCITPKLWEQDGAELQPSDKKLYGPGRTNLKVRGMFSCDLKHKEKICKQEKIYVVEGLEEPLLSRPVVFGLNLIQKVDTVTDNDYKKQHPKLWEGLGYIEKHTYTIRQKPDATPYAVSAPRRVPVPYQKKVEEELERLQGLGVIRPVTTPTEWCAPIVVVPKANSEAVRICVDLTKLNESVMRENYPLPSTDQLLAQLEGAQIFSKLDCNSGFYQIPLAEDSQELTTFITPFGRYCFQRLPFGISSGSEVFHRMMSQMLTGIPGVICDIDDVLVSAANQAEHDERMETVMQRLEKEGVTLNEKCKFNQTEITFLGHVISKEGVQIDPAKTEAIKKMPKPENVAELRRFLGLVNFVRKFSPGLADKSRPLRELLKKDIQWTWDSTQEQAFQEIKQALSAPPVLAHYSTNLPTKVSADASSYGLGAVLLQKKEGEEWRPVFYASRSMTATEQRYAQVEKEALASTWACEKFADYLIGLPTFIIETDHRPLLALLHTKQIDELSPRIQRFRMRLMRYRYTITYTAGKDLVTADALSRAPTGRPEEGDLQMESETTAYVQSVVQGLPATDQRLEEIRAEQGKDQICIQVKEYCQEGWPQRVGFDLKPYLTLKDDLSVQQGLLMYRDRLVIPASLRKDILQRLHAGHQGIVKTRALARASVWWPGLSTEINSLIDNCPTCLKERRSKITPMIPTPIPDYPWQRIGTDLMEFRGENYLVVVDYFSKYIELGLLKSISSEEVINHLKSIFARHGIPETVMSDNGTQYTSSKFASFASTYGFTLNTSSPLYPQSNGEAERAVQTLKGLLKKASDPYLALLNYRATPLKCGFSPAEKLFGRKLRTQVPAIPSNLIPNWPTLGKMRETDSDLKLKQKRGYDRQHRATPQPELRKGDLVWIKNEEPGKIVGHHHNPRSLIVETSKGLKRRNQRDLNKRSEKPVAIPEKPKRINTTLPKDIGKDVEPGESLPQAEEETLEPLEQPQQAEAAPPVTQKRSARTVKPPERLITVM